MKKSHVITVIAIAICCLSFTLSFAQEKASKEECVAKAKEAAQYFLDHGLEETIKTINDLKGPFVWKDSYVFFVDMDKKANIANPVNTVLIGKNMMGLKDANGKTFAAEFIEVANTAGEGWVTYMWPKPGEKTASSKVTYVYKIPGHNLLMASGIYE
ncbi:MAG: cache domain-containing protein [Pseudomonadota bacterium]